jgi:hypothetical protein
VLADGAQKPTPFSFTCAPSGCHAVVGRPQCETNHARVAVITLRASDFDDRHDGLGIKAFMYDVPSKRTSRMLPSASSLKFVIWATTSQTRRSYPVVLDVGVGRGALSAPIAATVVPFGLKLMRLRVASLTVLRRANAPLPQAARVAAVAGCVPVRAVAVPASNDRPAAAAAKPTSTAILRRATCGKQRQANSNKEATMPNQRPSVKSREQHEG